MLFPADLARLRAVWPAIVAAKGGWPPEPFGLVTNDDHSDRWCDPRRMDCEPDYTDVPDLTLPGTRAAALAWLGIDWHSRQHFAAPVYKALLLDEIPEVDRRPVVWDGYADESAEHALCAIERWHEEHCR